MNESPQKPQSIAYDDEIDLRDLFRALWAGKWLIGGATLAAAVIAMIVALMLPNIYRAEALLAPNDQERAGGLSALAAQYGGLASLAGINLGGSGDETALGLEILKSRKFITEFIDRRDILVPLMAAEGWDSGTSDLQIDPDVYDVKSKEWNRDVRPPKSPVPSSQEAYKVFSKKMSVSQDNQTGFITVAIEHYSPAIAKQWVDWLIDDLNASIMRQDVARAEQAIEYLHEQIEKTSLADLQNVFFRLVEEQTKTIMLARVSKEYRFKTVDPAIAPELKSKPKRFLIVIIGMMLGCFLGIIVVSGLSLPRR